MTGVIPQPVVASLRRFLRGRRVVVLGSAPLKAPLVIGDDEVVVAVNGGISSFSRCDVWVVNAWGERVPGNSEKHHRMIAQGKNRKVGLVVFLSRTHDAVRFSGPRLAAQGVTWDTSADIQQTTRVAIETGAGARKKALSNNALSAGFFAACAALVAGATRVRLEGFSWEGGYAYHPGPEVRGHVGGDKIALTSLVAVHGTKLVHSLEGETPMAKTSPTRAAAAPAPAARPAVQRPAQPAAPRRLRVRATKLLQYRGKRIQPKEVFVIDGMHEFRKNQMVLVDAKTPIGKAPRSTERPTIPWMDAKKVQRLGPNHDPLPEPPAGRAVPDDDPLGADGDDE